MLNLESNSKFSKLSGKNNNRQKWMRTLTFWNRFIFMFLCHFSYNKYNSHINFLSSFSNIYCYCILFVQHNQSGKNNGINQKVIKTLINHNFLFHSNFSYISSSHLIISLKSFVFYWFPTVLDSLNDSTVLLLDASYLLLPLGFCIFPHFPFSHSVLRMIPITISRCFYFECESENYKL